MKYLGLLLVLLPVVFTAPQKRFVLDDFLGKNGTGGIISLETLKQDLQIMLDTIGGDPTEQKCEQEGHKLFHAGLVQHAIPLLCHSFQEFVNHFHIVPQTTTAASAGKRFVLDQLVGKNGTGGIISVETLKQDLQIMLDTIGGDPTEQKCEQEGHKLFHAGLVQHTIPLICHSFQEFVNHFHIAPQTTTAASAGKRFVLDQLVGKNGTGGIISVETLKQDLQIMLDTIGGDPTEQKCEQEGHKLFHAGLVQHTIPLICHSFQEFVNHFHIAPQTTTAASAGKRFVLDQLVGKNGTGGIISVETLKQDLQIMLDTIGGDPTEQKCEQEGHKLFHAGLVQHTIPLICHSFQEFVNHFHIAPQTTTAASAGKRFVLDQLVGKNGTGGIISLETLKQDLQIMLDTIGGDPTEQKCEQEGHKLFHAGLVQHTIPLICHSFQEFVNHFHIAPQTTTAASAGKRFVLDQLVGKNGTGGIISVETLKQDLQIMLDTIGGDPTEQKCEQEGHKLFHAGLVQHTIPLICHSFQEFVNHFHIAPQTTTAASAGKRFVLDQLVGKNGTGGIISVETLKQDLQIMLDTIGGDPTEQKCEQEGHKLFHAGLVQHTIPLICHSFQEFVNHFHIAPQTTTAASAGKRFVLDQLVGKNGTGGIISVETLKQDLQIMLDTIGGDPTEQKCEQEGHKLFHAGLVQHTIPLVCHSFQEFIQHFHIVAQTTTAASAGKRFVADQLD